MSLVLLFSNFRFRRVISVSELYQIRDVIDIVERDGQLVAMLTDDSVSPTSTSLTDEVSFLNYSLVLLVLVLFCWFYYATFCV